MKTLTKLIRIGSNEFADMMDVLEMIKNEGKKLEDYYYKVEITSGDVLLSLEFTEENDE